MISHLDTSVLGVLQWPIKEREAYIQRDRWIGYDRASEAIDKMQELMDYPRSVRMPSMLLVGDPGNGKSTLLSHFAAKYPIDVNQHGCPIVPVLYMDTPSTPEETRLWSDMLAKFEIAHRDTQRVQSLKKEAIGALIDSQTKILLFDEFHNVLYGTPRQQRHYLAVLKNLSNQLKLPIVCSGTQESILVMHTDPQLSSRFEAFGLHNWELNTSFLQLLASFERLIPLAYPSSLASREIAVKLYGMCQGNIGALSKILEKAAIKAINKGTEQITSEILDSISWVKVSDYHTQAKEK